MTTNGESCSEIYFRGVGIMMRLYRQLVMTSKIELSRRKNNEAISSDGGKHQAAISLKILGHMRVFLLIASWGFLILFPQSGKR